MKRRLKLPPIQLASNRREDIQEALNRLRDSFENELVRLYTEVDNASSAAQNTATITG